MTGYPPPPPSFPPRSPYPPPAFPPAGGAAYLPGAGYGVTHSRPTDVMGRRIGAYAIDLAIAFVIFMVMFFALASTSDFNTTARQFYERNGYREVGPLPDLLMAGASEILLRKTIGPAKSN